MIKSRAPNGVLLFIEPLSHHDHNASDGKKFRSRFSNYASILLIGRLCIVKIRRFQAQLYSLHESNIPPLTLPCDLEFPVSFYHFRTMIIKNKKIFE